MAQDPRQKIKDLVIKLNEKSPYYIIVVVIVLVLLLDYFLLMQFQVGALTRLKERNIATAEKIEALEADIANFDSFEQAQNNLDLQIRDLQDMVHSKTEIPRVLEEISQLAAEKEVTVRELVPDTTFSEPILRDKTRKYFLLPISITMKAAYHDFGRFLAEMQSSGILSNISGLSIEADERDSRRHHIVLTFSIVIFEEV
ncbi:MAG: type 4a pilus biogenesis protein PilO [Candidatus Omnitrophota bacterium]